MNVAVSDEERMKFKADLDKKETERREEELKEVNRKAQLFMKGSLTCRSVSDLFRVCRDGGAAGKSV